MEIILIFFICLFVGALISGIIMLLVRSKLKSVSFERTACNYTRAGSFKLTNKNDIFVFRNVTRVPIPRNTGKRRR
ncbi:MAG: hypothetical protein LBI27_09340 [Clostridiales bacterium]|jgi:hypothetical protein|nr:hypothetical protein [Clostridiales bacterium]